MVSNALCVKALSVKWRTCGIKRLNEINRLNDWRHNLNILKCYGKK